MAGMYIARHNSFFVSGDYVVVGNEMRCAQCGTSWGTISPALVHPEEPEPDWPMTKAECMICTPPEEPGIDMKAGPVGKLP